MRLNQVVPNFDMETTEGKINFYDYTEKSWVLLFSHPSDFTPVCTTELGKLAVNYEEFHKRNCLIVGLSCDHLENHKTWLEDIKSYCPDIKVKFPYPIIADPKGELALKLGMLEKEDIPNVGSPMLNVRALYLIDPEKKVRLIMVYPTSTGRNLFEVLRALDSLQLVDKYQVIATPANWTRGEKVMIKPNADEDDVKKHFNDDDIDVVEMPSKKKYVRTTTKYE